MVSLRRSVLPLLSLVGAAFAQSYAYTDNGIVFQGYQEPYHNVTYGFVLPPTTATGATAQEFIGEVIAPVAAKWIGYSLGGLMTDALLIAAWPNNNAIVFSPRYATSDVQPLVYVGPTITTLKSNINATHWTWIYRCQNCTTWLGGSLNTNGVPTLAWAIGLTPVLTPSDPATNMNQHDDFNFWGQIMSAAHSDNYASYLAGGTGTVSVPPSTTTPSPTSTTSTPTAPTVTAAATPYDYIIVGGGPGGLVSADRLSQAGKKVLLIERGGPSTAETGGTDTPPWANNTGLTRFDIPGEFQAMFGSSGYTYWFCSDVSSFAGCLIGGGTSINGGLYWYPTSMDFSTDRGWPASWTSYTSAAAAVESRLPSTDAPGTDGKRYLTEVMPVMQQMLSPLGFTNITINNNPNQKDHAYGYSAYNFQAGKRAGPVASYFRTAKTRTNFHYAYWTMATSVARNGSTITGVQTNNSAIGPNGFIPLNKNGRVILSAGSFGSPRILFNSGIGPSDMLSLVQQNPAQVNQLPPASQFIDLPVGMNVQDNPSINLMFQHPSINSYDNWANIWDDPYTADAQQYLKSQSGIFADSSPRVNFWRAYSGPDSITRYMQGTVRPGFDSVTTSYSYNASQIFSITLYLSTGITSRGRVGLTSSAGGMGILTNPWFTDVNDKDVLITGINEIVGAAANVPNLRLVTPDNTTTITDYVNNYSPSSLNSNHWLSSNKIGVVVDENLKVMNTTNLFIVDASIVPAMPTGNPQGAIMTMAEMAIVKILALAGGP